MQPVCKPPERNFGRLFYSSFLWHFVAEAFSMSDIIIIGGGPAGLMAAEAASQRGASVCVYEAKPTMARKFLMAGKSGLNITHSEPLDRFLSRYGDDAVRLAPFLRAFPPEAITAWMAGLGIGVKTGSSGMVFPQQWKASPLLRAWLRRLDAAGVQFFPNHFWQGFEGEALVFKHGGENILVKADRAIFACGGGSWPRLGSDGGWRKGFEAAGIKLLPFQPSNGALLVDWSAHFVERFHGAPLKGVRFRVGDVSSRGEAVVTKSGLEGSGIYQMSEALRQKMAAGEQPILEIDLLPDSQMARLEKRLEQAGKKESFSNLLRKAFGLRGAKASLVREAGQARGDLPKGLKRLPLTVAGFADMERAISSVGGVPWEALDDNLMVNARPNVYCVGEMVDWDAPTGGYLLSACLAMGLVAGRAAAK